MQQTREFTTPDGAKVLVEVNSAEGNTAAVLMVHGFTGDINEHIFFNAAQLWPKKGLDVWRINLYPGEIEGVRRMTDIRWEKNLMDVDLVLTQLGKEYEMVFVVGHSKGGTQAVYMGNPVVKAKVLWDPAIDFDVETFAEAPLNPEFHTLHWGSALLVSKTYSDECLEASRYTAGPPPQPPTLVVRAEDFFVGWPKKKLPAKVVKIRDSDHSFNKEGNEKKLFRLTLNFFKKHALMS